MHTNRWTENEIDNFSYLLYLNQFIKTDKEAQIEYRSLRKEFARKYGHKYIVVLNKRFEPIDLIELYLFDSFQKRRASELLSYTFLLDDFTLDDAALDIAV